MPSYNHAGLALWTCQMPPFQTPEQNGDKIGPVPPDSSGTASSLGKLSSSRFVGWLGFIDSPVPWASLCCKLPTRYSKFDNYGRRNKPEHSSTITDANLAMHLLIPSLMIAWLQYALHQPRLYKPKQLFCCRIGRLRLRHPYETRHGGFLQFLGYCSASLARCKDIHSPIVCFR